jgi:signal transduction histidine kinase
MGKKVRDVMPAALADIMMDALERACRSDDPVVVEYELATDEVRFYEARIVKSTDRLLSIVRDVTESKRTSELNRELARRLIASQEVERQRIARDLHDDVSQRMALLNLELDQVATKLDARQPRSRLRRLSALAGEIASDVHNLSYELHPSKLQALGLAAGIQSLCRDASKQRDLQVAFTHGSLPTAVDATVSLCLYRIVQEALHNITRHSRAREAQVSVDCDGEGHIALQIADSGIGFNPKEARYAGLGLLSMQERVAVLKGHLAIQTYPGEGTRISVRIPLAPQRS